MKYIIPVRFTGKIEYEIEAESEEKAIEIANELGENADCGELSDVEWIAKSAVSIQN